jgi:hypothetical protein
MTENLPERGQDQPIADESQSLNIESLAPTANRPTLSGSGSIEEVKASIQKSQESTHSFLAIAIFAAYAGIIVWLLTLMTWGGFPDADRKEFIILILTSQATLIGTALGFYFSRESS